MDKKYVQGVEDALKWVKQEFNLVSSPKKLEQYFWAAQGSIFDEDRFDAFSKGAGDYMCALRETMIGMEKRDPEEFHHNAMWMQNYLLYVQAVRLAGKA